ncbi:hypothetical protein [Solirubrobacter pauli]|uniref:hypothetical protein n=1 Tax=Solirubrobacter pauli TaxID=166793 RepID=UPI0011C46D91|nr:hypothetical protein [Solirubrobacter pauli]
MPLCLKISSRFAWPGGERDAGAGGRSRDPRAAQPGEEHDGAERGDGAGDRERDAMAGARAGCPGDQDQDGDAERRADLSGGVQQAGRGAAVGFGDRGRAERA